MPNIFVGTINPSAATSVAIGTSSGTAVVENINRVGLTLTNTSTSTIFLGLGGFAATLNGGIVLTPNGGAWTMDEYSYTNGTIYGISFAAGSNLAIQEFTR